MHIFYFMKKKWINIVYSIMTIPKIIHQIWIGPNKKPNIWTDTFEFDYISKFPDWKYVLWNDDNIKSLFDDFPIMKLIYDEEQLYCGKADILRLLILYQYVVYI